MNPQDSPEPPGRRDDILARIREALRIAAPEPFSAHGSGPTHTQPSPAATTPATAEARSWLPPTGSSPADHKTLLAKNLAALKADFRETPSPAALAETLRAIASAEGWTSVASMRSDPLAADATTALGLPVAWADASCGIAEMESASAGITRCDCLVAQTGTVVLCSPTGGGRVLSVLPPHHVVLAREGEIVKDLPAAFELLAARYGEAWPGFVTFISGPSRTGDIERILVLGAHGPKKLTVILTP